MRLPDESRTYRRAIVRVRSSDLLQWDYCTYFRLVRTFGLVPLQGATLGGRFPGLKRWVESSTLSGFGLGPGCILEMSKLQISANLSS
jgi:hypothetical protein